VATSAKRNVDVGSAGLQVQSIDAGLQ